MTIKELRENQGLTVQELARKANVSHQTIYRIERGEEVSRVFVARVCRALGKSIDEVEGLNIRD